MKRIVLIETLHTGTGLEIIKSSVKKNIELCFVTAEDWIYKNCPSNILESINIIEVDWDKTDVRSEFIKLNSDGIDTVLFTQRDGFVEDVSKTCEEFNINFQSPKAIKIGRNKDITRGVLSEKPVSSPACYHVRSRNELDAAIDKLCFPIIAKPADGSGSKGIVMLKNSSDIVQLDPFFSTSNINLLLEEYKVGELISVETFTYQGKNYFLGNTNRMMTSHPNFIELGYAFPYQLTSTQQDLIKLYTNTILDTLDYRFGFCHIEYIVGKDDIYLVEVNPRMGGGQLGNLMSKSLGLDVYDLIVDALFDQFEPSFNFTSGDAYGCYTVYPSNSGKVCNISGLDIAKTHPNIVEIVEAVHIGDSVSPPSDMLGHAFQVIAKEDTAERALLTAYSAATSISIDTESNISSNND